MHPREFPNKRESVTSEAAFRLAEYIKNIQFEKNFYVNLPHDKLSLHDLFKITDLVLNNSSTVGLEAALFGIPVLGIGDDLYSFDPALQLEAKNLDHYINMIDVLVNEGWSVARVKLAFRWLNYLNSEVAVDISDVYNRSITPQDRNILTSNRYIQWAIRRVGIHTNPCRFVHKRRGVKPKNQESLTYAILNNQDSHIGIFNHAEGSDQEEHRFICEDLKRRASLISSSKDRDFIMRIDNCLNSEACESSLLASQNL